MNEFMNEKNIIMLLQSLILKFIKKDHLILWYKLVSYKLYVFIQFLNIFSAIF